MNSLGRLLERRASLGVRSGLSPGAADCIMPVARGMLSCSCCGFPGRWTRASRPASAAYGPLSRMTAIVPYLGDA